MNTCLKQIGFFLILIGTMETTHALSAEPESPEAFKAEFSQESYERLAKLLSQAHKIQDDSVNGLNAVLRELSSSTNQLSSNVEKNIQHLDELVKSVNTTLITSTESLDKLKNKALLEFGFTIISVIASCVSLGITAHGIYDLSEHKNHSAAIKIPIGSIMIAASLKTYIYLMNLSTTKPSKS